MKQIEGFPNYVIDEFGNVFNVKSGKMKAQQTYNGYKYVQLCSRGQSKTMLVHRLVAKAYIPNLNNLPCVNHKDENKANNSVDNLEWCTHAYNNTYGVGKPTEKAVEARKKPVEQYSLDGEFIASYESTTAAQKATGVNQSNISQCCKKKKGFKTAGGFVWKYERTEVTACRSL